MIVLDTDHLSVLKYHDSPLSRILERKLDAAREPIFTSIVSVEEQLRGWLSFIKAQSDVARLVVAYRELEIALHFTHGFRFVPFNLPAAEKFATLKRQRIRIGTQDLKIAAMVLANDATLLSRNLKDFSKVLGLKVQNWLE
jgi:tRNA(fMet)-specific endonuclease VapC